MRSFLEQNKLFFETVAATLLSLMALIVSIAQIVIAVKQTNLTEIQAIVAREQVLPQLVVSTKLILDEATNKFQDENTYVYNQGGIIREFRSRCIVFLKVELVPHKGETRRKDIPLIGYYNANYYTSQAMGKQLTIAGYKNNAKAIQLDAEFRELARTQNSVGFTEVKRYLRLEYQDILGYKHTRYFKVEPIFGGAILDEEEGKRIFTLYDEEEKKLPSLIDLSKVTPQDLMQMLVGT